MTFEDFLNVLGEVDPDKPILTIAPGPFTLMIGNCDRGAAEILLELDKKLEPDTKISEVEAALMRKALEMIASQKLGNGDEWYTTEVRTILYAWWWLVFWASQVKEEKEEQDDNSN